MLKVKKIRAKNICNNITLPCSESTKYLDVTCYRSATSKTNLVIRDLHAPKERIKEKYWSESILMLP